MLLQGIDDNILLSYPYYLGVYQYEAINESSTKRESFFWVGTKPKKTDKSVVHVTHAIINIGTLPYPITYWKWGWVY